MIIDIEPATPRGDYYAVRDSLIQQGRQFDASTLHQVPYDCLYLCCIGNSGPAACSLELVQQEKRSRRERFMHLEADEFEEATLYLKLERMYDDVVYALACRDTVHWADLTPRQQLWAKFTCLLNHVDNPTPRLEEALCLLRSIAGEAEDGLLAEHRDFLVSKLGGMMTVFPGKLDDRVFRDKLEEMADGLYESLSSEEQKELEKEQIQDFTCTSDCFRVF